MLNSEEISDLQKPIKRVMGNWTSLFKSVFHPPGAQPIRFSFRSKRFLINPCVWNQSERPAVKRGENVQSLMGKMLPLILRDFNITWCHWWLGISAGIFGWRLLDMVSLVLLYQLDSIAKLNRKLNQSILNQNSLSVILTIFAIVTSCIYMIIVTNCPFVDSKVKQNQYKLNQCVSIDISVRFENDIQA